MRFFRVPNRRQHDVNILYDRGGTTNILVSTIRQTRRQTSTLLHDPYHVPINGNVMKVIRNKIRNRVQQLFRRRYGNVLVSRICQSLQLQNRTFPFQQRLGTSHLPQMRPTINGSELSVHGGTTTPRLSYANGINEGNALTRGVTRGRSILNLQHVKRHGGRPRVRPPPTRGGVGVRGVLCRGELLLTGPTFL